MRSKSDEVGSECPIQLNPIAQMLSKELYKLEGDEARGHPEIFVGFYLEIL